MVACLVPWDLLQATPVRVYRACRPSPAVAVAGYSRGGVCNKCFSRRPGFAILLGFSDAIAVHAFETPLGAWFEKVPDSS